MSGGFSIGPLFVPYALLLVMVVAAATLQVGRLAGRRLGVDVEPSLWRTLLVGLALARLGYVWEFHAAYFATPLSIVDIRDGGWSQEAGFVGAWLFVLRRAFTQPHLKTGLFWSMGAATTLWFAGEIVVAMQAPAVTPLPVMAFDSLDGTPVALNTFAGKPTVVNLWATWCPPCSREMPLLQQAQSRQPTINFVFLNQGESPEQVKAWLARTALPLRNVLLDPRMKAGAVFSQKAFPTTLFFDAHGQLVATRLGELSLATLTDKLAAASR